MGPATFGLIFYGRHGLAHNHQKFIIYDVLGSWHNPIHKGTKNCGATGTDRYQIVRNNTARWKRDWWSIGNICRLFWTTNHTLQHNLMSLIKEISEENYALLSKSSALEASPSNHWTTRRHNCAVWSFETNWQASKCDVVGYCTKQRERCY